MFLEKCPRDVSRGTLSMVMVDSTVPFFVYIRQKVDNQFRDITYTSSIAESKIFLKINNFSYIGYQSKTYVEHIEQVIINH